MRNFKIVMAAIAASAAMSVPAFAESAESCGDAPQAQWMSKEDMTAKATALGYEVRQVKVEGSCYEVYGIKDGQKVEVNFNPVTGEPAGKADED
jgi:hypothetical protein